MADPRDRASVDAARDAQARDATLRAGIVLYALGLHRSRTRSRRRSAATPRGSARSSPGRSPRCCWWRAAPALAASLAALPLLYLQWQAPIRDVSTAAGDPSVSAAYYQPLLAFLSRQTGPPFRVEIPFTQFHWEAYEVAPRFPLARGWERQLDIKYNHLFYGGTLTAAHLRGAGCTSSRSGSSAVPDATLDFSAARRRALIDRGLPYLRLVMRTRHWRVYAVANADADRRRAPRRSRRSGPTR